MINSISCIKHTATKKKPACFKYLSFCCNKYKLHVVPTKNETMEDCPIIAHTINYGYTLNTIKKAKNQ